MNTILDDVPEMTSEDDMESGSSWTAVGWAPDWEGAAAYLVDWMPVRLNPVHV